MTSLTPQKDDKGASDPLAQGFGRLGDLLFAAAAFQTMRASCELGLLDALAQEPYGVPKPRLATLLGVEGRWLDMLLTAACATGLAERSTTGQYSLPSEIAAAVADPQWPLFKAAVAFEQYIAYPGIQDFTESLQGRTNVGIRHFSGAPEASLYQRLAAQPNLQIVFYDYMRAWSQISRPVLMEALASISPTRLLDVGGGDAVNSIAIAEEFPELWATVLDIAAARDIAEQKITEAGLSERIEVCIQDIFATPFPGGYDVVLFAHQLVIWTEEENLTLLRKANGALPVGGHIIILSSMTDDSEDGPRIAALASIYHACIPVEGGRIYPWRYYEQWLIATGFEPRARVKSSGWTPHGAIVAEKVGEPE